MDLKERIIESASALFFQRGVKSMTMSDIANELGISKRTLYEVFRDKEDLLEHCINARYVKAKEAFRSLTEQSDDVIDSLMQIYVRNLSEMRTTHRLVMYDLKKYHPDLYKKVEQRHKENVYILLPLLEKGVKQGLIHEDINLEIIIWLVSSQIRALMLGEYFPMEKYSTDEFFRTIMLNFIRGIATPSGSKKINTIVKKLQNQDKNNDI
jgi:AcrR family transcriptional regulator